MDITGDITVSGTVDGRDVATDGTKLDGIESGADVTPSWVPSSDPSYLTSHQDISGKLDKSGGTMSGDLDFDGNDLDNAGNTTLVDGKSIQFGTTSPVYLGAGVGNDISVSGTVDGRDLSIDGAKLDNIEAGADVTDAANVAAAGALMTTTGGTVADSVTIDTVNDSESTLLTLRNENTSGDAQDVVFKINPTGKDITIETGSGSGGFNIETGSRGISMNQSVDITGDITVSGTVDGRDVATDGTKLDGIEAGADVTPSWVPSSDPGYVTSSGNETIGTDGDIVTTGATVVKDIYMTDGVVTSHTERTLTLSDLGFTGETDADKTDAANVAAAGALMTTTGGTVAGNVSINGDLAIDGASPKISLIDSDATDFAILANADQMRFQNEDTGANLMIIESGKVRAIKNLDAEDGLDVTGDITVSGTVDGRDVAADGTKLDGIEAGADVTDAANVAAAGALMTTTGGTVAGNVSMDGTSRVNFGQGHYVAGRGSQLDIVGFDNSAKVNLVMSGSAGGKAVNFVTSTGEPSAGSTVASIDDAGNLDLDGVATLSDSIDIRTSGANDAEGSKLRLTEGASGDMGGFVHYDALANELNIGVHATSTSDDADDVDAITIGRDDANVTVNNDLGVTGDLTVGGNFNVDSLTMEGTSPSLQFNDTDSGSSAAISGDAGALTLTGDVVMGDTMKMPVDGAPASPSNGEGLIYFDTTANEPKFHDGSSWNSFGGSYTLPAATDSVRGGIELASNTVQTVAAESVTATAGRTYGVQVNSAGQGVVNVPWTAGGGSGVTVSGTAPGSPSAGDMWFDTSSNTLKVYTTEWESITHEGTAITMHSVAAAWVAQVEANDGITLNNTQKGAISDFTQALEDNSLDSKVKAFWMLGFNAAAGSRDLIAPTSQFTWSTAPTSFSNGTAVLTGTSAARASIGNLASYGMTFNDSGWVLSATSVDRDAGQQNVFSTYTSSSSNFSARLDSGEWSHRGSYSSLVDSTNEKQEGVFLGCRDANTARMTRIKASRVTESSFAGRTGGSTPTGNLDVLQNAEGSFSTMGLTTALTTDEQEDLGQIVYDLAVALGHTDLTTQDS
ncbi:MAG: hypothetical protein CMH53_03350 [Myxococcales bacterium]|nr:hypothetical protein [Myxococcales bacterium]